MDAPVQGMGRQDWLRLVRGCDGPAGLGRKVSYSVSSMDSASLITRSCCLPATTGRKSSAGQMAETTPSAARKARSTKADFGCLCWPNGLALSNQAPSSTTSCRPRTGCRPCWRLLASPVVKGKLLTGYQVGGKTFRNHLDGYNFKPFFEGKVEEGPRREFFYFSDNADLMALRYNSVEDHLQDHCRKPV